MPLLPINQRRGLLAGNAVPSGGGMTNGLFALAGALGAADRGGLGFGEGIGNAGLAFQNSIAMEEFNAAQLKRQELLDQLALVKFQTGEGLPAAIREYQFSEGLSPEGQAKFMNIKRGDQLINRGNQIDVRSAGGGITESYPVAPKPDNMPEFKADQTTAVSTAKANAERNAGLTDKGVSANNVLDLITEAEKILPNATSGRMDNLGTSIYSGLGGSDKETQADSQLDLLSGALTSNVPRFEGPQGVMDVELYKQMAADVGNRNKPSADRLAALKTMRTLNEKYAKKANPVIPPINGTDLNANFPAPPGSNMPPAMPPAIIRYDAQGNRI